MTCYTDRNCEVSHQCEFVCDCASSDRSRMICYTGRKCKVSHQCGFVCA